MKEYVKPSVKNLTNLFNPVHLQGTLIPLCNTSDGCADTGWGCSTVSPGVADIFIEFVASNTTCSDPISQGTCQILVNGSPANCTLEECQDQTSGGACLGTSVLYVYTCASVPAICTVGTPVEVQCNGGSSTCTPNLG